MAQKKGPVRVTVPGVDQNQPAHLWVSTFPGMYDRNIFRLNHYLYNTISLNINTWSKYLPANKIGFTVINNMGMHFTLKGKDPVVLIFPIVIYHMTCFWEWNNTMQ